MSYRHTIRKGSASRADDCDMRAYLQFGCSYRFGEAKEGQSKIHKAILVLLDVGLSVENLIRKQHHGQLQLHLRNTAAHLVQLQTDKTRRK